MFGIEDNNYCSFASINCCSLSNLAWYKVSTQVCGLQCGLQTSSRTNVFNIDNDYKNWAPNQHIRILKNYVSLKTGVMTCPKLYYTINHLKAWKYSCFGRNVTCTSWRRAHHCRPHLQERRGFSTTAQCRQLDAWSSKPISSTSRRLSEASVTFMMDRWHIHDKHTDIIFARRRLVQYDQDKYSVFIYLVGKVICNWFNLDKQRLKRLQLQCVL